MVSSITNKKRSIVSESPPHKEILVQFCLKLYFPNWFETKAKFQIKQEMDLNIISICLRKS